MRLLVTGGSGFIGTNYIDLVQCTGVAVRNLDIRPPAKDSQRPLWTRCTLLDVSRLREIVAEFEPTHIVHLAAVTGVRGTPADFAANVAGARNLLSTAETSPLIERVLFTSSTLVCAIGHVPTSDTEYCPTTAYGASKAQMEQAVREYTNLRCSWTIVRPVSIWGPWFGDPYKDFFRTVRAGWYWHLGSGMAKKSLGYVENTAHQIHAILTAPHGAVHAKTFYLADAPPVTLYEFAETVRKELSAPALRRLPLSLAKSMALAGDLLCMLGWENAPLTRFRLNNMLTEYVYDVEPIMAIAGPLPRTLGDGVRRTIEWLQESGW